MLRTTSQKAVWWIGTLVMFGLVSFGLLTQGTFASDGYAASINQDNNAQPPVIGFQGKIGIKQGDAYLSYTGTGYFKFAIVNQKEGDGEERYWANDDTALGIPATAVPLLVQDGLFSVMLGDTTLPGMTKALNANVFVNPNTYLRIWFSQTGDGVFEAFEPNQRIGSIPYALNGGDTLQSLNCTKDQIAKWDGAAWACATNDTAALEARIARLENLLAHFSRNGNDITISGANIHIVNGAGATDTANGLGNIIIGYNEFRGDGTDVRSGSHMVSVGKENNYSAYGGIVVGRYNETSGAYASVSGGERNVASGRFASITGGRIGLASGEASSISGGNGNDATGESASVTGGVDSIASGSYSTISGGGSNKAIGIYTSISGGVDNSATNDHAWVGGGRFNEANGLRASVSGGFANKANLENASLGGEGFMRDGEGRVIVEAPALRLQNAGKVLALRVDGAAVDIESETSTIVISSSATGLCPWQCNNILFNPFGRTTGNIGIGTAEPQERLDVAGRSRTKVLEITGE